MTRNPLIGTAEQAPDLRQRAEARLIETTPCMPDSTEELQRVLHELRVHQIELEMQNDELRRTQLELETSRTRWMDLYEMAPVGYLTLSEAGTIVESNLCAATLLGVARGQLLAQPFTKFIVSADQDAFYLLCQKLQLTDERESCELRLIGARGAAVWAQLAATAVLDCAGTRVLRIVLIDITMRKQCEASTQAQKVAEAASHVKSAFLANMSHELRTPLNAIIGFAYLLKLSETAPTQVERVDKIIGAGRHLVDVIDSVLSLSRIEAGKLVPLDVDVNLAGVVDAVVSMVSEQASAKGLQLVTDSFAVAAHLRGDPTLLQQALLNFAANAVKFTHSGKVVLRTRVGSETADHMLVRFEVEDTGIGIDPESLPRLFSAFEQADNSWTRQYGGTGLGLAVARRLARLMGGDAGATSTLGQGSTFWFSARLRKVAVEGLPTSGARASDAGDTKSLERYVGSSVLLAEDEPLNREVMVELLAALDVDCAVDGVEAVDFASRKSYDLILMDMQMPRMDGLEAVRRIRQIPGNAGVPILALTASGFDEDRQRCMQAGMDAFLSKPVDSALLFATVAKWLSQKDRT